MKINQTISTCQFTGFVIKYLELDLRLSMVNVNIVKLFQEQNLLKSFVSTDLKLS